MRKFVWVALCGSLVAACGGGGGGDTPALQPTVGVSATNQDKVGRAAASAVVTVAGAGAGATASSGGAGIAAWPGVSRAVALAMSGSRKTVLSAGAQPLAVQPISSGACAAGGTAAVTLDDTNGNGQPDFGEALVFTFDHCQVTANDSVNGTLSVSLASASRTAAGITFTGTMTFAITATEGTRTGTITGSVQASYTDVSSTVSRTDLTVGASNLAGTVSAGGVVETLTYENGFSISETDTADAISNPLSTSTIVSGALTSSELAGRVVLATQQPIVQLAADLYPGSGVLRATGTSGSALRLTILNTSSVQLDLDADGNGSYEATRTVNWSVLLPSS